jgi:hypothetical protein
VSHLTEADEEFSQDFDENVNTIRQPTKKKSLLVKPSDMLGRKTVKNASSKDGPQLSRLGNLLSKRDKAQKILMSKKRKSFKQLEKSNSLVRSRENLETEEGLTMVNQPLISAEVQSFSDRLS